MTSRQRLAASLVVLAALCASSQAQAQSPSVLYTWDNTGNAWPSTEQWARSFGAGGTSATLSNTTLGTLTIQETSGTVGGSQAFNDQGNRIRESLLAGSGGLDLTGLEFLQFDLGHTGASPINVQFFVQARQDPLGQQFLGLGPDVSIAPGMNTYQVPLSGLSPDHLVYIRTLGFQTRDHAAVGNVTWSLNEVRSVGTPLAERDLITHNTGTADGGLQGAIASFDFTGILGNNGGANQTGLSHNASDGSLQWTDVGGGPGGAILWGNGTGWRSAVPGTATAGNTFNNRAADLSNYDYMILRIKATDPLDGGGSVGFGTDILRNNFASQSYGNASIPIDGRYHNVKYSLAAATLMEGAEAVRINMFGHAQNLIMNVDRIRFLAVPEPSTLSLLMLSLVARLGLVRRGKRTS